MKKAEIIKHALINSISTAIYVVLIALFIYLGERGVFEENPSVFIPIAMLMLFVFSAAFTGFMVFGRPVMWYLDGKKKEAMSLLLYTLGFFLIITILVLFLLVGLAG